MTDRPDSEQAELPTRVSTKRGPFAIAPVWWMEYDLTVADLRVLIAITSFADNHGNGAFPKRDTIAKRARVSLSTYQRARARLEPLGLIRVEGRTAPGRGLVGYDLLVATTPAEAIRYAEQWEREHPDGSSRDTPANAQVKPDGSRRDTPAHWRGADGSRLDPADGSPVDPSNSSFVVTGPTDQTNPPGGDASRHAADDGALPLDLPEPTPKALTANAVVAAYVEAYRASHDGAEPLQSHRFKIGKNAKVFLTDPAVTDEVLVAAAQALGAGDFTDLGTEINRVRSGSAQRPSIGRRSRSGSLGPAPVPPRDAHPPADLIPPPDQWSEIEREVYGRSARDSRLPEDVWVALSNRLRTARTPDEDRAARAAFDEARARHNAEVATG